MSLYGKLSTLRWCCHWENIETKLVNAFAMEREYLLASRLMAQITHGYGKGVETNRKWAWPTHRLAIWWMDRAVIQTNFIMTQYNATFRNVRKSQSKNVTRHSMTGHGSRGGAVNQSITTQLARSMAPTWGPAGSCRPQAGPMLAPWTLVSGNYSRQDKNPYLLVPPFVDQGTN